MPFIARCAAASGVCLALMSCRAPADNQQANALQHNAAETRPLPVAEPALNRENLLIAAMRAASAYATGTDDGAAQRKLDGKRFELRMRFGCRDSDAEGEGRGWSFDDARRTLRLRVMNDISADDAVIAGIVAAGFESVEGLWLRRPWQLEAACPRVVQPPIQAKPTVDEAERDQEDDLPAAVVIASPRVGIAQFYSHADPRTARREQRPYEATRVLDEGERPSDQGYDFVLSGRLRALPDRRVIACWSDHAKKAPDCIISVRIDRAWIERPGSHELLAEWHGS